MHRRTIRGNRLGLTATGVLFLIVGVAIVALNRNLFGGNVSDSPLYPSGVSAWISGHRWTLWVLVGIAAVLAVMALRWILLQLRTDRIQQIRVDTESDDDAACGRTAVTSSALCGAIVDDAESIPGVRHAAAVMSGARDAPELWLTVTAAANADAGSIRIALADTVIANARAALENPAMPCYLTLEVSRRVAARQL